MLYAKKRLCCVRYSIRSDTNPLYAYQYSYRRVRDPTASEVAMSPGPACRHTHTHISYFPFLFIRIAVGRGPLFESPWLGCHNRRAWWPTATTRRPSFSLAGYHSSPADASRCASNKRARHRRRYLLEIQRYLFDIYLNHAIFGRLNSLN